MSTNALTKNVEFWHWYPEVLVRDLTPEQLRWQPEQHDSTVVFALWHAYRACDELIHGLVIKRPSVFASQGWASRLPVEKTGVTPFGNGLSRAEIAAIDLSADDLCAYAKAVGAGIISYMQSMPDDEATEDVFLPFFSQAYPGFDRMSRLETIGTFAIGHVCEHLGEAQFIRGMMGLKGAPL